MRTLRSTSGRGGTRWFADREEPAGAPGRSRARRWSVIAGLLVLVALGGYLFARASRRGGAPAAPAAVSPAGAATAPASGQAAPPPAPSVQGSRVSSPAQAPGPQATPAPEAPPAAQAPRGATAGLTADDVDWSAPPGTKTQGAAGGGRALLQPGPGVRPPVLLTLPRVRYADAAQGRRPGGRVEIAGRHHAAAERVQVAVLVDDAGRVTTAEVRAGGGVEDGFDSAVLEAARAARFRPATRSGVPGPMWVRLTFDLHPEGRPPGHSRRHRLVGVVGWFRSLKNR